MNNLINEELLEWVSSNGFPPDNNPVATGDQSFILVIED